MALEFTKPEKIWLKGHPDFSEKWVQECICADPSILGLGDVELVATEKVQPKAGRLDVLLYDDQLNRRYEVELMLGATDPSHMVRCIEYWDIERRRYPAYGNVAVLVAEDITSRFLNVIGLLAGSIPLIAIQLVALRIDSKIALHCVRVLDQTALRTDDVYESGRGSPVFVETDRAYWEQRASPEMLVLSDQVLEVVNKQVSESHSFRYRKKIIDIVSEDNGNRNMWLQPQKKLLKVAGYVSEPELWVNKFDESGLSASLSRGNKAVRAMFFPSQLDEHQELLREFIRDAVGQKDAE